MPRVSTFCPRCGESIETEVPEEARVHGRAELACPACRFEFVIAPARSAQGSAAPMATPGAPGGGPGGRPEGGATPRATGAERTGPGRERRAVSFKPLAAGLMLFFVAVLGLWMGSVLVFSDDLVEAGFANMQGEGVFTGKVEDEAGRPLEGVTVTLAGTEEGAAAANTTTGADGRYAFDGISPGVHTFRFTKENHTTVLLEAPAYPSDYSPLFGDASAFGRVTMPAGDPAETDEVSRLEEFQSLATGWGWFTIVASVLALVGGWACLRRKGFGLALTGAIAGVLTFGFLVGSAVAFIALILVFLSRREFEPLRRPGSPERA